MANNPKVIVTADTTDAERKLAALERTLDRMGVVGDKSMQAIGIALASVTAAATAVGYALAKSAIALDDLGDTADSLGIGVNQLRNMQDVAAGLGVDAGALEKAFKSVGSAVSEAFGENSGKAAMALDRIGLSANNLIGKSLDDQLILISEAVAKIENPTLKAAMAVELLGKNGLRIVEAFKDPKVLAAWTQRLEDLGLAISEVDKANVDKLVGQVEKLKKLWEAFLQKTVAALAPYLIDIIENINKAIDSSGGFEAVLMNILDMMEAIAKAALILATVYIGVKLVGAFRLLGETIADVLLMLTPAGWIGRAATIVKGVLAATGLIAAAGAAKMASDMGDAMGDEFDKIRESINKTREARQQLANESPEAKAAREAAAAREAYNQKIKDAIFDIQQKLIPALEEELRLEQYRNKNGELYYEIEKALSDIAEKKGIKVSDIGKKIRDQVTDLKTQLAVEKELTYEKQLQWNKVKALAEEYKGPLTKATEDYMAATSIYNQVRSQSPGASMNDVAPGYTKKQFDDAKRALEVGQTKLDQLILETTNKNGAEVAAINEKYRKLEIDAIDAFNLRKQVSGVISVKRTINASMAELFGAQAKEATMEDVKNAIKAQKAKELNIALLTQEANMHKEKLNLMDLEVQAAMAKHTNLESLEKSHKARLTEIERAAQLEKNGIMMGEVQLRKVGSDEAQQIAKTRTDFEKKTELEKTQFALDQGAQLFTALGAQNRKAFEAAKAFNIANAIMNTYMAATKALATYPPPFSFIAAAAAVGMGLAQVAQIRSQQYSGRALGGPVMGNQSYIVGERGPELFTPSTTGSITRNDQLNGSGVVNVNFSIQAVDATSVDALLYQRRGLITQIISDAMMEKGQRGI